MSNNNEEKRKAETIVVEEMYDAVNANKCIYAREETLAETAASNLGARLAKKLQRDQAYTVTLSEHDGSKYLERPVKILRLEAVPVDGEGKVEDDAANGEARLIIDATKAGCRTEFHGKMPEIASILALTCCTVLRGLAKQVAGPVPTAFVEDAIFGSFLSALNACWREASKQN